MTNVIMKKTLIKNNSYCKTEKLQSIAIPNITE